MEQKLFEIIEEICSIEALQKFLSDVEDVNLKNRSGETALDLVLNNWIYRKDVAFKKVTLKAVQVLIDAGADVNLKNGNGRSIIEALISRPNWGKKLFDVSEILIKAGADANSKNKNGQTVLHVAVRAGVRDNYDQINFIRFLLQRGVDVNSQDCDGSTALHEAVQRQNKEVVECLIDAGADVNLNNNVGESIIEALISNYDRKKKFFEILKILLKAGADVNSRNEDDQSALHLAVRDNKYNRVDFIQFLMQCKADVDSQDMIGYTALHYAVQRQNKEIVECLTDAGANLNLKKRDGQTALHLAAKNSNVDLIKYLITRGADVNAKSKNGQTPLHSLMSSTFEGFHVNKLLAQADALEILLSANADVNAVKISDGETAVHYFIYRQFHYSRCPVSKPELLKLTEAFLKIIKIFIKYGADFNIKSRSGDSPMSIILTDFYRCKPGYLNKCAMVLEIFIKHGLLDVESLISRRNWRGRTILHKSCHFLHYNMIKLLVSYGANIEAVNNNGETPLLELVRGIKNKYVGSKSEKCKILDYYLGLNPDVNIIKRDETHILCLSDINDLFEINNYPEFLWKALIEYVAKKKSTGYLLDDIIVRTISNEGEYQSYFDKCTKELNRLQKVIFPSSWVNLGNILMDHKKKLIRYVENEEFVREFDKHFFLTQKYPIYGPSIRKRFSKAILNLKVMKKSAAILSSCLPCQLGPSHLVIKKIISYIKVKYLRYLCEPESKKYQEIIKIDQLKNLLC